MCTTKDIDNLEDFMKLRGYTMSACDVHSSATHSNYEFRIYSWNKESTFRNFYDKDSTLSWEQAEALKWNVEHGRG